MARGGGSSDGSVARRRRAFVLALAFLFAPGLGSATSDAGFPADHRTLRATLDLETAYGCIRSLGRGDLLSLREVGRSAGDRPIILVRLVRGGERARLKVLLFAQQHGNEVAGKDALFYLIRDIAEHPERLPEDLDLYVMPSLNPDGAAAFRRTTDAGADLNRDHLLLRQPETQALYRVVRDIRPHVAVDCHEFTRDAQEPFRLEGDSTARAWEKWPLIMLDALNHPLIPSALRQEGLRTVEAAAPGMAKAGQRYVRYTLGGPLPTEEIRPSTLEADDARNGVGSHGALAFIIESGVRRSRPNPQEDLGQRVEAYLALFGELLGTPQDRARRLGLVESACQEPLPPFLPTNTFWGNVGGSLGLLKLAEAGTARVAEVVSPLVMLDPIVKASVPRPRGYLIEGRAAHAFRSLLERHGIALRELVQPERHRAEPCLLHRVEEGFDEVYQRYGPRQIVARREAREESFPAGSLEVRLDQPLARRAIQVLEPCLLHGLYGDPAFRSLVGADGTVPVRRLP